jgi:general secretion pathway protein L
MSTLIVLLPSGTPQASTGWSYVLTHDGRQIAQQGTAAANLLPAPGRPAEIVAIVPVQALSWHPVVLPRGSGDGSPKLKALLEGLLEDRLLDDPAQLHLALGPAAGPDETRWVAVCDRAWLAAGLQALESAGRSVTRIVPEIWPESTARSDNGQTLPTLRAMGTPEQAEWVLTGLRADAPLMRLPLAGATAAGLPPLDENCLALAEPAVAAQAEQALGRRLSLETPAQRWINALSSPWELAQLGFASTQRHRLTKEVTRAAQSLLQAPAWRPVRIGLVVLLIAQLLGLNAWAWRENQTLRQRQADINNTLTQTFPAVQVVVQAPLQMAKEVALLRQASGQAAGDDLESLLQVLGTSSPAGRVPGSIEFSRGQMRLRGLDLGGDDLARLNDALRSKGYAAHQEADMTVVQQESR